jgi:hypothetical protein
MKKYILLLLLGLSFVQLRAQSISNQSLIGTNGYDIVGAVLHLPDGSYIVASNTDGDATGLKTTPSFGSMDGWLLVGVGFRINR